MVVVPVLLTLVGITPCLAVDLSDLRQQPLGEVPLFVVPPKDAMAEAADELKQSIGPLKRLLARSQSGSDWREYLEWPTLEKQSSSAESLDVGDLLRLYRLFNASENGLEMHQFVTVRRALAAAIEVTVASTNEKASESYHKRIEKLRGLISAAAEKGTPTSLEGVGPLLARLTESRQAPAVVSRIRSALDRPNLHLQVNKELLAAAVDRKVDRVAAVNDVVLGTPVRGTGHTSGMVLLNFMPSTERAVAELNFAATNLAQTRSSKGPVTVCTEGVTELLASKRIYVNDERLWADPTSAHASTSTRTTGIGIRSRFGKNMIRRMVQKKVAKIRPRAEAISERRAQEKVRREFEQETGEAIAKASQDYQKKFRGPLKERGWYPELLKMTTTSDQLAVIGRKALNDQIAAFTAPPAANQDAILAVRLHESLVNNAGEITLAGRTITQEFVEEQFEARDDALPESLASDPDQPPWSITFAKRKPIELNAFDGSFKLTIRGSEYTSGDRSFPAMDIWVTYKIESAAGTHRLIRDGEVQIYPPGFEPGGKTKLSVSETSLRRILQKRFGRVFKDVVEIEPLELPGDLAAAGPLPLKQFQARRDGWLAVGWRAKIADDVPVTTATTPSDVSIQLASE